MNVRPLDQHELLEAKMYKNGPIWVFEQDGRKATVMVSDYERELFDVYVSRCYLKMTNRPHHELRRCFNLSLDGVLAELEELK